LALAFLGTALLAQLESCTTGETFALGAFADRLDVTQTTAFVAELGHRETGKSQKKDKRSQRM